MRKIQFRAWDKKEQDMRDIETIYFHEGGFRTITFEDACNDRSCPDCSIPELEDIVVMQYTGLKDKNGVEIYEGDILVDKAWVKKVLKERKLPAYISMSEDECIKKNCFIVDWEDETGCGCCGHGRGYDYSEDFKNAEVIGNIYEDSELL